MLWPVEKRVPYAAIRERIADGSEGRRMRCIKGARHALAVMRAQGRTPGAEGRAKIQENRKERQRNNPWGEANGTPLSERMLLKSRAVSSAG